MSTDRIKIDVSLHYQVVQHLRQRDEEFILTIQTDILGLMLDGDMPDQEIKLGALKMFLVQVGNALNAGASLPWIFDSHQGTCDVGSALFDFSNRDYCPWVKRRFNDANPWDDVLILDRLTLDPLVRGQKLGLGVLNRAIDDWSGGCSLVGMKPFPLQYEGGGRNSRNAAGLTREEFPANKAESFRRLRAYYSKLGFERVGRSEIYVLCTKNQRPNLLLPDEYSVPAEFVTENFPADTPSASRGESSREPAAENL